jgi:ABC-type antimicrobial peptide transport system permease subunit
MATVGVVIGTPLGVVLGRLIWRSVAEDASVVSTPDVPIGLLVVVIACTVAVANIVAAVPAWAAARARPAAALRTE